MMALVSYPRPLTASVASMERSQLPAMIDERAKALLAEITDFKVRPHTVDTSAARLGCLYMQSDIYAPVIFLYMGCVRMPSTETI